MHFHHSSYLQGYVLVSEHSGPFLLAIHQLIWLHFPCLCAEHCLPQEQISISPIKQSFQFPRLLIYWVGKLGLFKGFCSLNVKLFIWTMPWKRAEQIYGHLIFWLNSGEDFCVLLYWSKCFPGGWVEPKTNSNIPVWRRETAIIYISKSCFMNMPLFTINTFMRPFTWSAFCSGKSYTKLFQLPISQPVGVDTVKHFLPLFDVLKM